MSEIRCRNCGAEPEATRRVVGDHWYCHACTTWQGDTRCPTCGSTVDRARIAAAQPAAAAQPGASFHQRLARLESLVLDQATTDAEAS